MNNEKVKIFDPYSDRVALICDKSRIETACEEGDEALKNSIAEYLYYFVYFVNDADMFSAKYGKIIFLCCICNSFPYSSLNFKEIQVKGFISNSMAVAHTLALPYSSQNNRNSR